MYALVHWLQLIIVPHVVFPSTSNILTQMFTVGSNGGLAHSLHSTSLTALQLACLLSVLAHEWAFLCVSMFGCFVQYYRSKTSSLSLVLCLSVLFFSVL